MAIGLTVLVCGCGATTSSAPPAPAARSSIAPSEATWDAVQIPARAWSAWRGTLTDVRPWSSDAAGTLADRARSALARDWTMNLEIDHLPIELAHVAEQDRVRLFLIPAEKGWWAEVHVLDAPPSPTVPDALPLVVCSEGQYGMECVGVTDDDGDGDASSDDPYLDGAVSMATDLSAREVPTMLSEAATSPDRTYVAQVDSPDGVLDCVVEAPEGTDPTALDGTPLLTGRDVAPGYRATCVDGRGLVLVAPGEELSVRPLTGLEPTADDDVTTYPARLDHDPPSGAMRLTGRP
jgi:hypothetical protein